LIIFRNFIYLGRHHQCGAALRQIWTQSRRQFHFISWRHYPYSHASLSLSGIIHSK